MHPYELVKTTLLDENIIRPPQSIIAELQYDFDAKLYNDKWLRERIIRTGTLTGQTLVIAELLPAEFVQQDTALFKDGTHLFVLCTAPNGGFLPADTVLQARQQVPTTGPDGQQLFDTNGRPAFEQGQVLTAPIYAEQTAIKAKTIAANNVFHFVITGATAHLVNANAIKVEPKSNDKTVTIIESKTKRAEFDLSVKVKLNSINAALKIVESSPNKFELTAEQTAISSPDGTVLVIKKSVNTFTLSVKALADKLDKLAEELIELAEDLTAIEAEFDQLVADMAALQTTVNSFNNRIKATENNYKNLQQAVTTIAENYTALADKVEVIDYDMWGVCAELSTLRNHLAGVEKTANRAYESVDGLASWVESQFVEVFNQLGPIYTDIEEISVTVNTFNNRIQTLEQNYTATVNNYNSVVQRVTTIDEDLTAIYYAHYDLEGRVNELETDNAKLTGQLNAAIATLNQHSQTLEYILANCCSGGTGSGGNGPGNPSLPPTDGRLPATWNNIVTELPPCADMLFPVAAPAAVAVKIWQDVLALMPEDCVAKQKIGAYVGGANPTLGEAVARMQTFFNSEVYMNAIRYLQDKSLGGHSMFDCWSYVPSTPWNDQSTIGTMVNQVWQSCCIDGLTPTQAKARINEAMNAWFRDSTGGYACDNYGGWLYATVAALCRSDAAWP